MQADFLNSGFLWGKMRNFLGIFLALSIFSLSFSCSDYEEMIDDYNASFSEPNAEVESEETPSMLSSKYTLMKTETFVVYAPDGYSKYEWSIDGVTLSTSVDVSSRRFALYLATSPLQSGSAYTLRLTVVDSDGSEKSDSAMLCILNEVEAP